MKVAVIFLTIAVLGLIVGGTWWLMADQNTADQSTATPTDTQEVENTEENIDDSTDTDAAITITYSDAGFSTSKDTVPAGSTVLIVNDSNETLQFSSDPHPQHSDNPELNLPTLEPGEQETMTVEEPGNWGFHNHLNDDHSGSITVTD